MEGFASSITSVRCGVDHDALLSENPCEGSTDVAGLAQQQPDYRSTHSTTPSKKRASTHTSSHFTSLDFK